MTFLFHNKQMRKTLVVLTIIILTFSIMPGKTEAQWAVFDIPTELGTGSTAISTLADKIKNWVIDPAARSILKLIIKKLTAQTVNWINSGFQGNPGFVSDPGQFFLNLADQTASQFFSETNLNRILCTPFQAQVRIALVKNYLQDPNNNSYCTLTTLKNNYNAFTQDFSQGGWDSWFQMTQTSSGNPYSAYFSARDSLTQQLAAQQNKYQTQLNQGNGFLSFEKCKAAPTSSNTGLTTGPNEPDGTLPSKTSPQPNIGLPSTTGNMTGGQLNGPVTSTTINASPCPNGTEVATPGSVIQTQLEGALGTDLKQLELARSIDEIASALITQLFSRVMGSTGLLQRSSSGGPIPEVTIPNQNKPFITLLAKTPMTVFRLNQNGTITSTPFTDPGAMAYDYTDGDISDKIVTTGSVNSSVLGIYKITYNVTNSKGVAADPMTLTVVVADINPDGTSSGNCPTCASKGQSDNYLQAVKDAVTAARFATGFLGSDLGNQTSMDPAAVDSFMNKVINDLHDNGYNAERTPGHTTMINVWKGTDPDKTTYTIFSGMGTIGDTTKNPACSGHMTTANVDVNPDACLNPSANTSTTSAVPVINSISPVTAVAGVTTIIITGSNLTDQVSFFDSNGGNTTETGTVNSAKTQTTITVPDNLLLGFVTVKIYQGNNVWSNGIVIKITSPGIDTGTPIPIP